MKQLKSLFFVVVVFISSFTQAAEPGQKHNVIIFVADGLRWGSVNKDDTPALWRVRSKGVHFINSHSLFPTFTTPNASAIATGHFIGDTGDFGNTLLTKHPIEPVDSRSGKKGNVQVPFIEDNLVLACIDEQFPGANFLDEEALLAMARSKKFLTAAVGKLGPVAIQDVSQATTAKSRSVPATVIIDDYTGHDVPELDASGAATGKRIQLGVPLSAEIARALTEAGIGTRCTDRDQPSSGTLNSNEVQQKYFIDAFTRAILPEFQKNAEAPGFVAVYWSRDPDGTQHNHGDNLGHLSPGINGPTCLKGVKNADNNLQKILDYLDCNGLACCTDVFVTSDHGFSTISKGAFNACERIDTTSYSANRVFEGVKSAGLPPGFLAMDLAHELKMPLCDPNDIVYLGTPNARYMEVDVEAATTKTLKPNHKNALKSFGSGYLGDNNKVPPASTDGNEFANAEIIVCANGGSDLIYLPKNHPLERRKELLEKIVDMLTRQDYVSGIFVDDLYGNVAGTLPLSAVNLKSKKDTTMPVPALIVNFRTFSLNCKKPVQTQVEIADTGLAQGQGMHGSFGRGDTYNNMAAIGPSFKRGYTDKAPACNADVAQTLAHILGLPLNEHSKGDLKGRVLEEALACSKTKICVERGVQFSLPRNGMTTFLLYQTYNGSRYFHAAGFPGRTVIDPDWSKLLNK